MEGRPRKWGGALGEQLWPETGQREVGEGRCVLRTSSPTDTRRVQGARSLPRAWPEEGASGRVHDRPPASCQWPLCAVVRKARRQVMSGGLGKGLQQETCGFDQRIGGEEQSGRDLLTAVVILSVPSDTGLVKEAKSRPPTAIRHLSRERSAHARDERKA